MGMKMDIDYPSEKEISAQKKVILDTVFPKRSFHRLNVKTAFSNCRSVAFISIIIYVLLLCFCYFIKGQGSEGYVVLALYPLTWFSFYFLSVLAEEQSGMVELKRSMKYSFTYLISIRMLYTNIASVFLNLAMIVILYTKIQCVWNLAAAGTTANILLAMASLSIYEKTGSARLPAVLAVGWLIGCGCLMKFGNGLYHLIIEVIPLTAHIFIALLSFLGLLIFMKKVEYKNAYSF